MLGLLPSSTNEQIKVRTLFLRSSWYPKRNTGKHSQIGNDPLGINYMVCKVFFKSDFLKNRTYFFLKLICYITSNPQLMLIFWYSHHTFHNPMRLAADYLILWASLCSQYLRERWVAKSICFRFLCRVYAGPDPSKSHFKIPFTKEAEDWGVETLWTPPSRPWMDLRSCKQSRWAMTAVNSLTLKNLYHTCQVFVYAMEGCSRATAHTNHILYHSATS